MQKRKLTKIEIDDILSFFKINKNIPESTSLSLINKIKKDLTEQLKNVTIYPDLIPILKKNIEYNHYNSLIQPGESVGIICAQSIGEKQTQTNLNTFHKAGQGDKQPTVSNFNELLNVTCNPKLPSYLIHLEKDNESLMQVKNVIGKNLVQINIKNLIKNSFYFMNKKEDSWYNYFYKFYKKKPKHLVDCIRIEINMDIIYDYKLSFEEICNSIENSYEEVFCIFSPDCYEIIDIYIDTSNLTIPENSFITEENYKETYFDEIVLPKLENIIICGIPGILNVFYLEKDKKWYIETENIKDKKNDNGSKKSKSIAKLYLQRFKKVLSLDFVDYTKTISNNVWDIYHTFGIEAARQYMIDQFSKIMESVNICHIMILVDKITYSGTLCSISRYTMRNDNISPFAKSSFEEAVDNFLKTAVFGQDDNVKGVSSSIICGKQSKCGTGLCSISVDIDKLIN